MNQDYLTCVTILVRTLKQLQMSEDLAQTGSAKKRNIYLTHVSEKFRLGQILGWVIPLRLSLTLCISCFFLLALFWGQLFIMGIRRLTAPSLYSIVSAILLLGQWLFQNCSNDSQSWGALSGSCRGMCLHTLFSVYVTHWLARIGLCTHSGVQG